MGRTVSLDRQHLIRMLTDTDFYMQVPEFAYLKDIAMESQAAFKASSDCAKCGGEWKFMRGVVDAFFLKIKELSTKDDSDAIDAIKAYMAAKKGSNVTDLVIYYRRSRTQGKIAKLTF